MVSTVLHIQHSMCSIVNTFKGNLVFQCPLKTLMIINLFKGGNNILSEMNFKKCHLRSNISHTMKNTVFHRISKH